MKNLLHNVDFLTKKYAEYLAVKAQPDRSIFPIGPVMEIDNDITSTISVVFSKDVISDNGTINSNVIKTMFDKGFLAMTGTNNQMDAWNNIFPIMKKSDIVGIKVNAIYSALASHIELVDCIVQGLIDFGVKRRNIIIWDNMKTWKLGGLKKAGFIQYAKKNKIQCITTESAGYDYKNTILLESVNLRVPVSKLVTKICNYIINVPVLKDHFIAGVTACLKNMYGAMPLLRYHPFRTYFFFRRRKRMIGIHKNLCNPQIAELYSHPLIKDKVKLHLLDGIWGAYNGGPLVDPQFENKQIIFGSDPVSIDMYALKLIDKKRKENKLPSIVRKAKYIQSAAEMGLGTNNFNNIKINEISC